MPALTSAGSRGFLARYGLWILIVAASLILPFLIPPFRLNLLGRFLSLGIVALGVDLIWGYTGMLSLGQGIFFALGGYGLGMYLSLNSLEPGQLPEFFGLYGVAQLPLFWKPFASPLFTLVAIWLIPALVAGVVFGRASIGMAAFAGAVALTLVGAADEDQAIRGVPWGTILMVCGVTVLISLLEKTSGLELFTGLLARVATKATVIPLVARIQKSFAAWLEPAYGTFHFDYDIDRLDALADERTKEWTRIGAASFLSDDEKREAVGYGPRGVKDGGADGVDVAAPAGEGDGGGGCGMHSQ